MIMRGYHWYGCVPLWPLPLFVSDEFGGSESDMLCRDLLALFIGGGNERAAGKVGRLSQQAGGTLLAIISPPNVAISGKGKLVRLCAGKRRDRLTLSVCIASLYGRRTMPPKPSA